MMKRGDIIKSKVCYKCKKEKDISQFRLYPSGVNKGLYRSYCKDCTRIYNNEYNKKHFKDHPWCNLAKSISGRCCPTGCYFEKGIKKRISVAELKKLWFRDKAWLLKRPSIDRIDSRGDYSFENCRFIELSENCRRARLKT